MPTKLALAKCTLTTRGKFLKEKSKFVIEDLCNSKRR